MTVDDRYDVSGLPEAQFEPGSNGLVLKNLLGITSKQALTSTMRQWSVCSERLSSGAVRLLNRRWLVRFSQDAGDGFDGGSGLDRRRAGDAGDQGLPVFRRYPEMRVGVNKRLALHRGYPS